MKHLIACGIVCAMLCGLTGCKEKTEAPAAVGSIPIPVKYDSEKLNASAMESIASFYYAIETKDAALYQSVLSNEFLAYSELYFENTDYTFETLMETYYDITASYVGKDDFNTTLIEVKDVYKDDDTQVAIDAMDQVSQQVWQVKASAYWTDCFSVKCDVTVQAVNSDTTYVITDSIVYVVETEGQYLLIIF